MNAFEWMNEVLGRTKHCSDIYNTNLRIEGPVEKLQSLASDINNNGFRSSLFSNIWTESDLLYQKIQDAKVIQRDGKSVLHVYLSIWETADHYLMPLDSNEAFFETHTIGDEQNEDEHWTNDTDGTYFPNKYFFGFEDNDGEYISFEAKSFEQVKDLVKTYYPEVSRVKDIEELHLVFEYIHERPVWLYYKLIDRDEVSPKTYAIIKRLIRALQ